MEFDELLERHHGVVSAEQLMQSGQSRDMIRTAVRDGLLIRVRHGWYRVAEADEVVVEIVADGAVVSCITALERAGLWVPEGYSDAHHSRITRHERRRSTDRCRRYGRPSPAQRSVDRVIDALQYAVRCATEEDFIILCDSALNTCQVTLDELRAAFATAPKYVRRAIEKCEPRAASGTETAARLRLRAAGMAVKVQHRIGRAHYVDLLVGERLAIEVDSRAHHTGEINYESDRARDRKSIAKGYIPMHITYRQVFTEWHTTFADILRAVRSGYHRAL